MAYNFKNLADVELLAEVPEGCTAFAEVDGVVKRVPSKGLGGEGGIKTVIIKDNNYDDVLSGNSQAPQVAGSASSSDFTTSMTFDEVMEILASGEPLQIYVLGAGNSYTVFQAIGNYSFSLSSSMPMPMSTLSSSGSMAKIIISVRYRESDEYYTECFIIWTSEGIYYQPLGE